MIFALTLEFKKQHDIQKTCLPNSFWTNLKVLWLLRSMVSHIKTKTWWNMQTSDAQILLYGLVLRVLNVPLRRCCKFSVKINVYVCLWDLFYRYWLGNVSRTLFTLNLLTDFTCFWNSCLSPDTDDNVVLAFILIMFELFSHNHVILKEFYNISLKYRVWSGLL